MDLSDRVDRLVRRLDEAGRNTPSTKIYAEGIKVKLREARFALQNLKELEHIPEQFQVQDATTITPSPFTVDEKVNFYCESFWDFLRSSLDILAQLINELTPPSMNERQVDFKKVGEKLKSRNPDTPLQKSVDNCLRCRAFKSLEDYRHCSTHRRQVFILKHTTQITGTPAYAGSAIVSASDRFLCKNPWDLLPRVDKSRPVGIYCEQLLQAIEGRMNTVINRLP